MWLCSCVVKWVAGSIALLSAAVLFAGIAIGGELHKAACVAKAEAQTPWAFSEKGRGVFQPNPAFLFHHPPRFREEQIAACSGWL